MPSAGSISPHPPAAPASTMSGTGGVASRPPLMKRQSSQSSNQSRHAVISPGSVEHQQPLRHPVKKHTKIILPRNHSSGRNLAKLNRQTQAQAQAHAEEYRRHGRQRSHEGDTEIRLPGSLDESVRPTTLRRNMTASQLPRNTSHAKLKKNFSHGQLTRLGSGKNLAGLNAAANRAPPSPGLRGKQKRPKSAEMSAVEKDAHERETRLHQRKGLGKKVGFAVGSAGDASDEEDAPEMEGSMQEDEWTEESASASPYSTRQNTANNSRRTSMVIDRAAEKLPLGTAAISQDVQAMEQERQARLIREQQRTVPDVEERRAPRPHGTGEIVQNALAKGKQPLGQTTQEPPSERPHEEQQFPQQPVHPKAPQRSPLHAAKEHANPATRRLLDKSQQLPAPALVSNVSAMDDTHSNRGSPAASMRSSRSNLGEGAGDQHEDELVSRFVPSASHPSMGSGTNTAVGTPKHTAPHTPEDESTLAGQRRDRNPGFNIGPVSPGSTVSGTSSGAATPAIGRSRTELRMLQEKAMADIESQADQKPHLPAHVYDRRNESLKSYLNMAPLGEGRIPHTGLTMGPDVFQGRFRALNTELRVVQKFRDPIGEAVARLKGCRGSALNKRSSPQKSQQGPVPSGLPSSKSAISLPVHRAQKASDLAKSASPPNAAGPLKRGTSTSQVQSQGAERQKQRREVSFRAQPETREFERSVEELPPDVIARQLWESV
ncbi:hypothetical protein M409DRAFT_52326 [Zasmidium cellare ATCC 36951]|uniref:Uncharacterized protein n=1 Tax=Zasmidium cellare ATCC 36951 TaxID=1080233 RepID=A0A6A6CT02_ZASCE|nr:uncharacterized protein M409DRAFT_52326 [Zasmidium cellare ATCC 36951]KAF2169833.1 hypothetical protein M409DRAFT_52326 [Zasmidium cellare ATCC 36951]